MMPMVISQEQRRQTCEDANFAIPLVTKSFVCQSNERPVVPLESKFVDYTEIFK
jgi:hypothetical protein